ncbi:hypothetical protein CAI21_15315 [Alkalilimnicola ehrlichii]|uniref:Uroporphyrinogen-III C-methyltransferase n=1 Tax=Alkalilimnicola ehrlichii TaxID=351052 RepID=A0A3E0WTV2_9GAMM|nr:uroporphyrinogen-III C-methyltransferase [Alkalilimnicola ehrlichii]RFA27214.1 hypothetical protein CAI21_15315 [Alkalilimnicola ehrlichii]RFA35387.1 hypothetical protein CAL65_12980 [Alkalilimnicola ehrlichii]
MADNNDKDIGDKDSAEGTQKTAIPDPSRGSEQNAGAKEAGSRAQSAKGAKRPAESGGERKGGGGALGALALAIALLVALAVAGGGYYLWGELQRLQSAQTGLVSSAELSAFEGRVESAVQETSELRARMSALTEDRSVADREVIRLQEQVSGLESAHQALHQRMARIDDMAEAYREDWIRGEVAYLARIADHRLRFHEDISAAADALQLADDLLANLGTGAFEQQQAISRASRRLAQVEIPDTDAFARRLETLIDGLEGLPIAHQGEPLEPEPTPAETDEADNWREALSRAWDRFTDSLGQLVIVERNRTAVPLLAPEERYFLYQNLRLSLMTARLALLEGNAELYRRSLEQAGEWLTRYYDVEDPRVSEALEEIEQLAGQRIRPALPDLRALLEPVTEQD